MMGPGFLKSGAAEDQLDWRGWEQVSDDQYTVGAPLTVLKNVRTLITNNAASIINSQIPAEVPTFWDTVGQKFQPDRSGDYYILRLSGELIPSKNNSNATIELDIGGSQGVIWTDTISFTKGAGTPFDLAGTIPIYTLGTFVANGGMFYITPSENTDIHSVSLVTLRTFKGRD